MDRFYKLAKLDGYDFRTGNTINYRKNLGKTVTVPTYRKYLARTKIEGYTICSDEVLHASIEPLQCFIGASIPCSCYIVEGKPVVTTPNKLGFTKLKVLEEIPQENLADLFGFDYPQVIKPIHPFKLQAPTITNNELLLLQTWDSVRASVGDSVGASVWDSVGDSVWAYIGSLFPNIKTWKYAPTNIQGYPYQSCVDLWKKGIVPSFDGKTWRLHTAPNGKVSYEVKATKLREMRL